MRGLAGGGEWSDPQHSLGLAMAEALRSSDTVNALSESLVRLNLPPLRKSLAADHFFAIGELADRLRDAKGEGRLPRSITAIQSSLDFVNASTAQVLGRRASQAGSRYAGMLRQNHVLNEKNRRHLEDGLQLPPEQRRIESLPGSKDLHRILRRGAVAIVSLEGYNEELRQTIVAQIMERLQQHRIDDRVPRFLTVVEEAHNFVPNRIDNDTAPSLPVLKQIASEGRKYGMGLVFVSQRPSRIDATILSQCNSFMILRVVNPYDQQYVRQVIESLGEEDARLLPDLSVGDALLSGQFVRFPVVAHVEKGAAEGRYEEEDFLVWPVTQGSSSTVRLATNGLNELSLSLPRSGLLGRSPRPGSTAHSRGLG